MGGGLARKGKGREGGESRDNHYLEVYCKAECEPRVRDRTKGEVDTTKKRGKGKGKTSSSQLFDEDLLRNLDSDSGAFPVHDIVVVLHRGGDASARQERETKVSEDATRRDASRRREEKRTKATDLKCMKAAATTQISVECQRESQCG